MKRLLTLALLLLVVGSAQGQVGFGSTTPIICPGMNSIRWAPIPSSLQNLTISTSVVKLTVPQKAWAAAVSVENNAIRFTSDGTDPAPAGAGTLVTGVATLTVCTGSLATFKMIRDAADTKVSVQYYGNP